jgi:UDP-glucuronate 4-epimerase
MSILVTGGAGFIGSHFIETLLRETSESVVCLDNFNDYYSPARKRANAAAFAGNKRVEVVEQDFCDAAALRNLFARCRFESVVHLGAYAGVRASVEQPLVYQHANVCGTASLLEAARAFPVKRFLFASSSTVYGTGAKAPFVEDAPLGVPSSPYGVSKRAAELLARTYFDLHGVPTVSLRFFSVYGPRLRPDLALSIFTERILRGEPIPLFGDGQVRRDFTHVRDVCQGLLAALSAEGVAGEAINLGHDEPIAVKELIALIEKAAGRPAKINRLPPAASDLPTTHADLSKARRLLGYRPSMDLAEGVQEFVDWHRASFNKS